jgi:thioredoxin 1
MQQVDSSAEFDQILSSNAFVLVDFYADWCGPCRMMTPILASMETVHVGVKFVKVNVDNAAELARRFEVTAMPTFLAIQHGKVIDRVMGADRSSVERMLKQMKQ